MSFARASRRTLRSAIAPLCALALALALTRAPRATAFELIGGSLDLTQRDVRLFDNFSDAQTNDNATPQSEFPGSLGAELAIWKAVSEWASRPHAGTGGGDPSQPNGLGSGAANFDASFQGRAQGVGGTNDNIHSALSGGSGGVLAYCETPITDGWRIRYYEDWTWDDGPGVNVTGFDLQGVACHEYGHALGLSHSADSSATMYPSILGSGVDNRSIGADDIAGLKAIYGEAAASKPRVTSVQLLLSGSTPVLTILGQFFDPENNEVWFANQLAGGNGSPLKVTGLASTNGGTRIVVGEWPKLLPAGAGAGDVFVRVPGQSGAALSNGWPVDLPTQGGGCPPGVPSIQTLFPASGPALVAGGQTVTLLGCGFSSATALLVDGLPLSALPPAYQVLSNTTLSLTLPQVDQLGPVSIQVENAQGSSAPVFFEITVPSAPVLDLNGPYLVGAAGARVRVGASPGDLCFVLASSTYAQSAIPGLLELEIGGNFSDLYLLDTQSMPPQAWFEKTYTFSGLATGVQLHFQALVFSNASAAFPLLSSNSATGTVLF